MKLAALLLLLGTLPCLANLGETEQQSVDRYGAVHDTKTFTQDGHTVTTLIFFKDDLVILVRFLDGKACCLGFSKESLGLFNRTDAEALLSANTDGHQWQLDPKRTDEKKAIWTRTDTGVEAVYLVKPPGLLIHNQDMKVLFDLELKHLQALHPASH